MPLHMHIIMRKRETLMGKRLRHVILILRTDRGQTFQGPSSTVDHGGDLEWE